MLIGFKHKKKHQKNHLHNKKSTKNISRVIKLHTQKLKHKTLYSIFLNVRCLLKIKQQQKYQGWDPRRRPWPQRHPQGHILNFLALASTVKSLALALKVKSLASKPQIPQKCPVLGSRTPLVFKPLKLCATISIDGQ